MPATGPATIASQHMVQFSKDQIISFFIKVQPFYKHFFLYRKLMSFCNFDRSIYFLQTIFTKAIIVRF